MNVFYLTVSEIKVNGVNVNLHAPQGNQGTQEPGAPAQGPPSGTHTNVCVL